MGDAWVRLVGLGLGLGLGWDWDWGWGWAPAGRPAEVAEVASSVARSDGWVTGADWDWSGR